MPSKVHSPVVTLKTAHEIAFSPSGNRAAFIGGRDVTVLNLRTRRTVFVVHPIANPSSIDFSPTGRHLVVKGTSGRTIILNASTGQLLSDFRNQKEGEGDSALFSSCGRFVASVSWTGLFSVRDWATTKVVFSQSYNDAQLTQLSATDDRRLFVYSIGRRPKSATGFTPCSIALQNWPARDKSTKELQAEWPAIWGLQISPSGRLLAIVYGTPPNTLEIYDISNSRVVARRDWSGSPGCSIAWTRDEKTVVVNGDENFRAYQLPKLTVSRELPVTYPCFVQFSPSEKHLALGSWNKSFIVPTDHLDDFPKRKKGR
jgi:WD40 repeat protein